MMKKLLMLAFFILTAEIAFAQTKLGGVEIPKFGNFSPVEQLDIFSKTSCKGCGGYACCIAKGDLSAAIKGIDKLYQTSFSSPDNLYQVSQLLAILRTAKGDYKGAQKQFLIALETVSKGKCGDLPCPDPIPPKPPKPECHGPFCPGGVPFKTAINALNQNKKIEVQNFLDSSIDEELSFEETVAMSQLKAAYTGNLTDLHEASNLTAALLKVVTGSNCSSLVGDWENEIGSILRIKSVDSVTGKMDGEYATATGAPMGTFFPLHGWINSVPADPKKDNRLAITFAVRWGQYGSSTSWTGTCYGASSGPRISTVWQLARPVSDFTWDHIITGADNFSPK